MKFNVSKIEIENFRSIQDKVTLNISPGLFVIEGVNMDEPTSTNGVGKSTLVSALYWCLTGNTLTNEILADEVVNLAEGKNCKVVVYIDSEQGEIVITRTRKDKELGNSLSLEIAGQNLSCHKITDTQSRLNQLIKIPLDLLHSTIMMTSDMKSAFSELSPQQRVQILESIRDYSIWDKVRDEANNDIRGYNKKLQENNLNISNMEGSLTTYIKLKQSNLTTIEQHNASFNKEVLEKQILSARAKKTSLEEQIKTIQNTLCNLNTEKDVDTSEIDLKLQVIIEEANNLKLAIQNQENEIKNNLLTKQYIESNLDKEIELITKWFTEDSCPTCNRKLDRKEEEIVEKNTKKSELLKEKEILNAEFLIKSSEQSLHLKDLNTKVETKRIEYATLNRKNEETKKIKNTKNLQITELEKSIVSLNKEISEIETEILTKQNLINNHDQKIKALQDSITTYVKEITSLTEAKSILEKENNDLMGKRHLSEFYYKLLGAKGELRPYLLSKDIQYLNLSMQKYITRLFKNTEVELKLNGAAIDIVITSGKIVKSISSLSGGEKKRVNIAIQLALYDLIQSTSRIGFNMLWLDEIETQTDELGIQQIINIIEDKSEEIETVFWISNNDTVKQSIPNKIVCKKQLGKTKVEY